MSSREHKEKIWNYIKDIDTAMMVTKSGNDLRARPMHIVQDDYDGTIWFYTKANADKTDEIQNTHDVCLTFCDHSNHIHVSMSGSAIISRDPELIEKFWNPVVASWFPNGKNDPNCALLEIKIHSGEHWDSDSNPITFLYEVAKANLTDTQPDMGENQKFGTV